MLRSLNSATTTADSSTKDGAIPQNLFHHAPVQEVLLLAYLNSYNSWNLSPEMLRPSGSTSPLPGAPARFIVPVMDLMSLFRVNHVPISLLFYQLAIGLCISMNLPVMAVNFVQQCLSAAATTSVVTAVRRTDSLESLLNSISNYIFRLDYEPYSSSYNTSCTSSSSPSSVDDELSNRPVSRAAAVSAGKRLIALLDQETLPLDTMMAVIVLMSVLNLNEPLCQLYQGLQCFPSTEAQGHYKSSSSSSSFRLFLNKHDDFFDIRLQNCLVQAFTSLKDNMSAVKVIQAYRNRLHEVSCHNDPSDTIHNQNINKLINTFLKSQNSLKDFQDAIQPAMLLAKNSSIETLSSSSSPSSHSTDANSSSSTSSYNSLINPDVYKESRDILNAMLLASKSRQRYLSEHGTFVNVMTRKRSSTSRLPPLPLASPPPSWYKSNSSTSSSPPIAATASSPSTSSVEIASSSSNEIVQEPKKKVHHINRIVDATPAANDKLGRDITDMQRDFALLQISDKLLNPSIVGIPPFSASFYGAQNDLDSNQAPVSSRRYLSEVDEERAALVASLYSEIVADQIGSLSGGQDVASALDDFARLAKNFKKEEIK